MAESVKTVYVSLMVDGREVLRPATIEDIKEWLRTSDYFYEGSRYMLNHRSTVEQLQRYVQPIKDELTIIDGLDKLDGRKP